MKPTRRWTALPAVPVDPVEGPRARRRSTRASRAALPGQAARALGGRPGVPVGRAAIRPWPLNTINHIAIDRKDAGIGLCFSFIVFPFSAASTDSRLPGRGILRERQKQSI